MTELEIETSDDKTRAYARTAGRLLLGLLAAVLFLLAFLLLVAFI